MKPRFGSDQPLVTIITPSYNQGEFLERTILSVLCQDYANIEYIVLDSMSMDSSAKVLDKYKHLITRVIREKDGGQTFAIDRGFKESSGELLAWLNSDDCYASANVVSQAVAQLQENAEADLIYGRRLYIDRDGNYSLCFPFREFCEDELKISDYIPQECCFWTRSIYDQSGGHMDTSFDFAMDYELFLRLLHNGARFLAINSVYGLFRYYKEQKSTFLAKSVGIPEIHRVQAKYCNEQISAPQMSANYTDHFFGVSRATSPVSYDLFHRFQKINNGFSDQSRRIAPLDAWVFHRDAVPICRR